MPTKLFGFDLIFTCEPAPLGGWFCYLTVTKGGKDFTEKAMSKVFGQHRRHFEGLTKEAARQHAIELLTPVLEELAKQP